MGIVGVRTENPCVECSIHSLPTIRAHAEKVFVLAREPHAAFLGAIIAGSASLRRCRCGFESNGDRFALFAEREKAALSIGAFQETYPPVGHAVFLPN
jgi:hypothetical protein